MLIPSILPADLYKCGPIRVLQLPGAFNFCAKREVWKGRSDVSFILLCFLNQQWLHRAVSILRRKHGALHEAVLCPIKSPCAAFGSLRAGRSAWAWMPGPILLCCFVPFNTQCVFDFADKWMVAVVVIIAGEQQGFSPYQAAVEMWHEVREKTMNIRSVN